MGLSVRLLCLDFVVFYGIVELKVDYDNKRKRDMKTLTCRRCGYRWYPRITRLPRQCPHCKNTRWNEAKRKK